MSPQQVQYTDQLIEVMEYLYQPNYLSQGGNASVDAFLSSENLTNKVVADIGCGTGGPALHIVKNYPVQNLVGIDVDKNLLAKADRAAKAQGLVEKVNWIHTTPDAALPLETGSIDLAFGKESWLHVKNKPFFFQELNRVLKPQGRIVTLDWMHNTKYHSNLMNEFMIADGLDFVFYTLDEYLDLITDSGFKSVTFEENSHFEV